MAAGAIGLVSDLIPGGIGHGDLISAGLNVAIVAIGVLIWRLSHLRVLHGRAALLLPLLAMVIVAAEEAGGLLPAATSGIWLVMILVWVGVWHPPKTAAALSPFVAAAYLAPLLAGAPHTQDAIPAVLIVVPVAVMAGETIAHYTDQVRHAEIAWERLLGELSRASTTDELTGVGNRRLGEMLLDAVEPGDAVVILDIDHFKEINDRFGHPEGDQLLRRLGAHLRAALREGDGVARMGGDEFMVVIRDAGPLALDAVSRLIASWREGNPAETLSAGVAVHEPRTRPSVTYAAADGALYMAKRTGRDRALPAEAAGRSGLRAV